jgi:undecaprenyl-diphosphatase
MAAATALGYEPPAVLFRLDEMLLRSMVSHDHGALWLAATFFSAIGGGWAMVALVPLSLLPRARRFAGWLTVTLALTALAVFSAKAIFGRGRPVLAFPDLASVIFLSPTDPSFPSGHAAGSFAFALFCVRALLDATPRRRFARALAVLCVLVAACVGVSRIVLGAHFPGDVLAGAILGSTMGGVAGRRFTSSRARRL